MAKINIKKQNDGSKLNIKKSIFNNKRIKVYKPAPPPISLYGLKLWVSADYGVTESGGVIQSVLDKSSNANNLSLSSGSPSLSSNIINGKPAFYFFGGRLYGTDIVTAKTIYAVVKIGNTSPNQYACILESTGGSLYSAILSTKWGSYFYGERPVDTALSTNTAYIIGTLSDNGISYKFRQNGSEVKSSSDGGGFYPRNTLYFGNDGGGGQPANCYVAEIIAYNRELTTSECQEVEAYLNSKYAIY